MSASRSVFGGPRNIFSMSEVRFLTILLCMCLRSQFSAARTFPTGLLNLNRTRREGGPCNYQGHTYPHGQVFSIPGELFCRRYFCYNTTFSLFSEGCEFPESTCHPVGSIVTTTNDCVKYVCRKEESYIDDGSQSFRYWTEPHSMCQGVYGQCSDDGETVVIRARDGHFQRCRCVVLEGGAFVRYDDCTRENVEVPPCMFDCHNL
ncbi:hypothetical protein RRG08_013118 [Elysia crispata]|uniref:Uncharacterized protein n=1 Tax=Elysia crispata TaxID=231223 RepID=A0AAE1A0U3_9GAST|nr:hypothetical protein RRG08_013118 [Elysia crispata]